MNPNHLPLEEPQNDAFRLKIYNIIHELTMGIAHIEQGDIDDAQGCFMTAGTSLNAMETEYQGLIDQHLKACAAERAQFDCPSCQGRGYHTSRGGDRTCKDCTGTGRAPENTRRIPGTRTRQG